MRGPVLVVDDDPDIMNAVSFALELQGKAVVTATNGAEALQVIERVRPSVVLLDLNMPVMDGWEFVGELNRRRVHLPIVVMTAAGHAADGARQLGAAGYLDKPFTVQALLHTVQSFSHDNAA